LIPKWKAPDSPDAYTILHHITLFMDNILLPSQSIKNAARETFHAYIMLIGQHHGQTVNKVLLLPSKICKKKNGFHSGN
jgi:hypothetical protein